MLMLVKIDETKASMKQVSEALDALGKEKGLSIRVQKEEIFDSMHRI